jgi:glycolate oxidase FAD binding subunit
LAAAAPGDDGRVLHLAEHCGIVDYRPEELVIKARAGTPLVAIEQTLAEHRQRLPFEPPRLQGRGTLGGAVACGLPGPGRPSYGSVRDAVLGVEMLNGLGEVLSFGGEVMKNVAGYDVSRLQTGAFGTLGVLLSISVRVAPLPAAERTQVLSLDRDDALARCREWSRRPYPITATAYLDGRLTVRLSGAVPAVEETAARIGGERGDEGFWQRLRDHELDFFRGDGPLWRCVLPPAAPAPLQDCLWTWSGGLRWWRSDLEPKAVRDAVRTWGGSAQPFDRRFAAARLGGVTAAQADYQRRIRLAFDPQSLFNPDIGLHHAD